VGGVLHPEGRAARHRLAGKIDPDYPAHVARLGERIAAIREAQATLALAEWLAPALDLGRRFALAWDEAKAREG
jgi:ATP-dependent helicase/nuclease subunit A